MAYRFLRSLAIPALALGMYLAEPAETAYAKYENLKGTRASLKKENDMADRYDLTRIEDNSMLRRFVKAGRLVPLSRSCRTYYFCGSYAYARSWTKLFVDRLASQYHSEFNERFRVSSAVRPKDYQNKLRKRNRNASGKSTHPTGATIDISKRYMNGEELQWMRESLSYLEDQGVIQATEEFSQPTFHIMVYPTYLDYVKKKTGKVR